MDEHTRQPTSLAKALRRGFRDAYDNLGYVVAVTFGAFVIASVLFSAALLIARATRPGMFVGSAYLVPTALAFWLAATGAFHYANRAVFHEHPVPADTWIGIRVLLWPSLGLFAVNLAAHGVLAGDTVFLICLSGARKSLPLALAGVGCGYLWMVWAMMSLYHLPLLAAQVRMESGPGVRVVLRKSFLLTLDNPGFTLGLFLAIIAFAVLCALPAMVGIALVFLGAAAFLLNHALRELFVKYGIIEEEPELATDEPWRLPDA